MKDRLMENSNRVSISMNTKYQCKLVSLRSALQMIGKVHLSDLNPVKSPWISVLDSETPDRDYALQPDRPSLARG